MRSIGNTIVLRDPHAIQDKHKLGLALKTIMRDVTCDAWGNVIVPKDKFDRLHNLYWKIFPDKILTPEEKAILKAFGKVGKKKK